MSIKGFTDNNNNMKTPSDISVSEKPLNERNIKSGRVDINNLRSKLEEEQSKEFRKNVIIFALCIFLLGVIGIYLSL